MTTDPQPATGAAPVPPTAVGAEVPQPESAPGSGDQVVPQQSGPEQAAPPTAAPAALPPQHKIKRTRISGLWVAVGCFAVILLLLLIFILQNGEKVDVSYMGAHGHLPLGVALLLAAVCGVLLVVLAGTARISQLRATARKHRRADTKRAKGADGPP
jgi:lipopolysaccharide assembly protein A